MFIYKDLFCKGKPKKKLNLRRSTQQFYGTCFRMGSFTSAPKILNNDDQDDDLHIPSGITRKDLLQFCRSQPNCQKLIARSFRKRGSIKDANNAIGIYYVWKIFQRGNKSLTAFRLFVLGFSQNVSRPDVLRVLQWNVLSQGKRNRITMRFEIIAEDCSAWSNEW